MLCSDLPTLTLSGNMPPSSITANINENLEDTATPPDHPYNSWATETCECNGIFYSPPNPHMPFIVTSPDKSRSSILIATHVNAPSGNLGNGPNVSFGEIPGAEALYSFLGENPANTLKNSQLNSFPDKSTISFFSPKSMYRAVYYVAEVNEVMALYRDTGDGPVVIAEHIEDFQCSFTLDDGTVINNRNLTNAEIPDVRLVTLSVVGRSGHQYRNSYGTFNGQRMALEDHGAGAVDNYRRRLLTVTVKVRNFGLN